MFPKESSQKYQKPKIEKMDSLLLTTELATTATSKLVCNEAAAISGESNEILDISSVTKDISSMTTLASIVDTNAYFGCAIPLLDRTEKENSPTFKLSCCQSENDSCNLKLIQRSTLKPSTQQTIVALKSAHNAIVPAVKAAAAATSQPPSLKQRQTTTPKPNEYPEVRNVIASTNLGCKLDLRFIAMHAKNVEYNPKMRDVLLMRIRRPFCLAFIYSSGKLICTGTKSCHAARMAARKFARVIQKLGIPIRFARSRVDNIIASSNLNCRIRLEALELFHHKHCIYEPELFPCLVYRLSRFGSQIFVFSSGTIVLCNIRRMSNIQESFSEFYSIVQPFRKLLSICG